VSRYNIPDPARHWARAKEDRHLTDNARPVDFPLGELQPSPIRTPRSSTKPELALRVESLHARGKAPSSPSGSLQHAERRVTKVILRQPFENGGTR